MLTHPLQAQYNFYHQHFDAYLLSSAEGFKLDVAKALLNVFIEYSALSSIFIDFKEVERISKVFEGSDEETIMIDFNYEQINDDNTIPVFFDVKAGLRNRHIDYVNIETAALEIKEHFYFMTEETSFLTQMLKLHRVENFPASYDFLYDSSNPLAFISQLDDFIGKRLKSALLHQQLNQQLDNDATISSQRKI